MLNYANLSDVEFENLCLDVMSAKLHKNLHKFATGRDGGIDLRDDNRKIVVQVKHYVNSTVDQLMSALKKEVPKVEKLNPKQYYVCCSTQLSPQKVDEIYTLFEKYMDSTANVITINEIDTFLTDAKNVEILKKHYKLWIESTRILEDIFTRDIGIDSEILFANIKKEVQYFVKTQVFDLALDCLKKTRALLIVGDPGVGKTVTSKMLVLHYLAEGYKIKYTTDISNLSDLKKALTSNPEEKEIIFLDDCFGQAYFRMKETQGNELVYIIKHVNIHPNKIIILNSRVTIYSDAKIKTPDLIKSFENKEFKLITLDMSRISAVDKAKILYNHMYFNGVDREYLDALKSGKRYLDIIQHPNFNPRIIEYVCDKKVFKEVSAQQYYSFIAKNLNNSKQAWEDEYENRIDSVDRLLLTTIYSLTNTLVSYDTVKACFEFRLQQSNEIDVSVNQFEKSLARLEQSLVKIVDSKGQRMISTANPSINDFLSAYLDANLPAKNDIISNSCTVRQLRRMLPNQAFDDTLQRLFETSEILNYYFESDAQRNAYVAYYVATHNVKNKVYSPNIHSFLVDLRDADMGEGWKIYSSVIISILLKKDLIEFYQLEDLLTDATWFKKITDTFLLDDLVVIVSLIEYLHTGAERKAWVEFAQKAIKDAIELYCTNVPALNYDVDLAEIHDSCIDDNYVRYSIEREIEERVSEMVLDEVRACIAQLPEDLKINDVFINNLNVSVSGASELFDEYFDDIDYDPELYYDDEDDTLDEIYSIFER